MDQKITDAQDGNWRVGPDGKVYKRVRKVYPNHDVYDGEMVGAVRQGTGTYTTPDGSVYSGGFENNMYSGRGKKTWAPFINKTGIVVKNSSYDGEWSKNRFEGKGIYNLGDGQGSYIGYFKNGLYDGEGVLNRADGSVIKGLFDKGFTNGEMIVNFADSSVYIGSMKLNKFHGAGTLKYGRRHGGGSYEGDFKWGLKHGKGTRVFTNGNKYVGDFFEDLIEGEGMMQYANGDVYIGGWQRGFYKGRGCIKYSHGDSYEGEFSCGFYYGEGTYKYADGGQYSGDYKNTKLLHDIPRPVLDSKRHGYGVRTWTSGSVYEGQWKSDLMEGEGVLTTLLGSRYVGGWVRGRRCGPGMEEYGNRLGILYTCPGGHRHNGDGFCVYTGDFLDNEFHGRGELKCVDGRSYSGQWVLGKREGEGIQVLLRSDEVGNSSRLHIGVNGSLYRAHIHVGLFKDSQRHGYGISIYTNGDKLLGEFIQGMPNGIIVCKFGSGRSRLALYDKGTRVRWIDGSSADMNALNKFKIDIPNLNIG